MWCRTSTILLLFILVSVAPISVAFERDEHQKLADVALYIAIDYYEAIVNKNDFWKEELCNLSDGFYKDVYRLLRKCGDAKYKKCPAYDLSYGKIAKFVDRMDHPRQIFEWTGKPKRAAEPGQCAAESEEPAAESEECATESGKCVPTYRITGNPKSHKDLNRVFLQKRKTWGFSVMRAFNHNDHHFQGGLFHLMTELHKDAILVASEGDLFAALVTNALSDHLLHDFFAPGHIRTPRENSHDNVALGMHDVANEIGSTFIIDKDKWDDLNKILRFVSQNHSRYELFFSDGDNEYGRTKSIISDLMSNHKFLDLQGDGWLHSNPKQTLFMLLVEVRSILDVLDSYGSSQGTSDRKKRSNSFTEYVWSGTFDSKGEEIDPPKAGISYGKYDIDKALMRKASNIYIAAIGGQAPLSQTSSSRLTLDLEIIPITWIGSIESLRKRLIQKPGTHCRLRSLCNVGPALGLAHIKDEDFSASGASVRIIKTIPKIATQFSFYYRRLRYDKPGSDKTKTSYGLRLDTGFSVYSANIAIGRGYILDSGNDLEEDTVLSFSIGFGIPGSRIKHVARKGARKVGLLK